MRRLAVHGALLVVFWVALWGEVTVGNILSGVAVAAILLVLFPPSGGPARGATIRPLRAAIFLGYFAYKVVEANLIVAWEVLTPHSRISQGIVEVPLGSDNELVVTLVANTVSLTPGTLTIEVRRDPPTLYIHVLHLRSIADTRGEVRRIEYLALRAFAPAGEASGTTGEREETPWLT